MLVLAFIVSLIGCDAVQQKNQNPRSNEADQNGSVAIVGQVAPDFTLPDMNGNIISLYDLRGKSIVLNFWAEWWPTCRAEVPYLEELHQQGKDLNLVVIGLSVDKNQDAVQKFVQDNNLNYPIITNSEDIADQYGLSAIPNTFFISGEGIIMHELVGSRGEGSFQSYIREYIQDFLQ